MSCWYLSIKSRAFKDAPKNDWFAAWVSVNAEEKVLHFSHSCFNLASGNAANFKDTEYATCEDVLELANEQINPSQISLLDYKAPKPVQSSKNQHTLELASRLRIGGKNLKFKSDNLASIQLFSAALGASFEGVRSSQTSLAGPSSPVAPTARNPSTPPAAAVDADNLQQPFDSNSAAAGGDQQQLTFVSSDVYESLDDASCFEFSLESLLECADRLERTSKQPLTGQSVQLYVSAQAVHLLDGNGRGMRRWNFGDLRRFGYSSRVLLLEVGSRAIAGPISLTLRAENSRVVASAVSCLTRALCRSGSAEFEEYARVEKDCPTTGLRRRRAPETPPRPTPPTLRRTLAEILRDCDSSRTLSTGL